MNRAHLNHDILRIDPAGPVLIGALPPGIGLERLRWTGTALVDLMDLTEMWVEPGTHTLHAVEISGAQLVQMAYQDRKRLVTEAGVVRLISSEEHLQRRRDVCLLALDLAAERFVGYRDGSDRYRQAKQIPFNAIGTTALAVLASPTASPEVKAYVQAKWDRLQQVMAWINEVLEYQYEIRAEIEASESPETVTWDFSFLDVSDPQVTLEEVRL